MVQKNKEAIIVSLGGSLVAPDEIDLGFLKAFKFCLQKHLKDKRFFIIVGGGKPARFYQKALLEFGAKNKERDLLGIEVTKLNAQVVRQLFGSLAYPNIISNPTVKIGTNKDVIVGAGFKPGCSTDYVSVLLAQTYDIKIIINLTNTDYVYDKNPSQFPDAKPLDRVDWKSFKTIVGDKWMPGLSMPFDPTAAKLAEKLKAKVMVINGKNLERFEECLNSKPFIGTIIG